MKKMVSIVLVFSLFFSVNLAIAEGEFRSVIRTYPNLLVATAIEETYFFIDEDQKELVLVKNEDQKAVIKILNTGLRRLKGHVLYYSQYEFFGVPGPNIVYPVMDSNRKLLGQSKTLKLSGKTNMLNSLAWPMGLTVAGLPVGGILGGKREAGGKGVALGMGIGVAVGTIFALKHYKKDKNLSVTVYAMPPVSTFPNLALTSSKSHIFQSLSEWYYFIENGQLVMIEADQETIRKARTIRSGIDQHLRKVSDYALYYSQFGFYGIPGDGIVYPIMSSEGRLLTNSRIFKKSKEEVIAEGIATTIGLSVIGGLIGGKTGIKIGAAIAVAATVLSLLQREEVTIQFTGPVLMPSVATVETFSR